MSTLTLKRIARVLVYISLLTPLLVFPAHFVFPFIVPKILFFRSLMVLTGGTLLLSWLYERHSLNGYKKITPLFWVLIFYFLSLIVSAVAGVDWRYSVWHSQERMLGLFTLVHYLVLFLCARYLFSDWSGWKRLFGIFSGVGALVVVIGIVQKFVPEFMFNRSAAQVVSTLGNPIYLSGLGLFLFFINALMFVREKNRWRWYFAIVAVLGVIAIFIAGTRGTFFGLLGGIALSLILYFWINRAALGRKMKSTVLIVVLCLFALGGAAFAFRETEFIRSIPLVGRIVNISPVEGTAATRLMAWATAWQGFVSKPVFGWGPNNYYYVFNQFYNPDFMKFGSQETWFDNAHNILANTLAEGGVVGILAYLGIFGAAFYSLRRIYLSDHKNAGLVALASGFLVGHFIHNLFVFENVTSYLYFFLFLAFIDSQYRAMSAPAVLSPAGVKTKVSVGWAVLVWCAALLVVWATDINVAKANNLEYQSRGITAVVKDYTLGLEKYRAAARWKSPYQTDIDWDYASTVLDVLPEAFESNTTTARQIYDAAQAGMENVVSLHPKDVRAYLVYTDILRAGIVLFDLPLKDTVDRQFKIARELSPGRQQVEYSELSFQAGTGGLKEAIEGAKNLVEKYPYDAEAYYNLARFLFHDRQYLEILPVLDKAVNNGVRFTDPTHLEFVAMAYEREGRFRDSLYWWDQMYKITGSESVKHKRDELSELTKKPVPQSLEEFFKFENR